jgi:hypothetical protein
MISASTVNAADSGRLDYETVAWGGRSVAWGGSMMSVHRRGGGGGMEWWHGVVEWGGGGHVYATVACDGGM